MFQCISTILYEDFSNSGWGYLTLLSARLCLMSIEVVSFGKQWRERVDVKESVDSILLHFFYRIIRVSYDLLFIPLYAWASQFRFFEFEMNAWSTTILCFVLTDFTYYWAHRYTHCVRLGWADHITHHTSRKLTLASAMRPGMIPILSLRWVPTLFLVLLGLPMAPILVCYSFLMVYQFWIHTEMVPKLGWVEGILNTPQHHRVHHAINKECINKNFGGTLIIWDRMFGTFKQGEPTVSLQFGVTENVGGKNFIQLGFLGWGNLFKDVISRKSLLVLFERTGK